MFLKISSMIINIGLKELKAGILERQEEKLEKIREDLIRRIYKAIKINKKKLKGKQILLERLSLSPIYPHSDCNRDEKSEKPSW